MGYEERRKKLEEMKEKGINPYPHKFFVSTSIEEIRKKYEKPVENEKEIIIRGIIKRLSNLDEDILIRLVDRNDKRTEIAVLVKKDIAESNKDLLTQEKEITVKGQLTRYMNKLTVVVDTILENAGEAKEVKEIRDMYDLEPEGEVVSIAGRVATLRDQGKTMFGHIKDAFSSIQIYLRKDVLGEEKYKFFKDYVDTGDILGVKGKLFRTTTGELTIDVEDFQILAKSLWDPPEKWHGLKDIEQRYRQRYLDLIANPEVANIFITRAKIISLIREFLNANGFIEVETPVLQPIYGGASAKPFITHHNALDMDLYLRIAPELYLKRLIVGGLNRVYEIGKNFRNEGIDTMHNPEFTMLEFYSAYWDYNDLMDFTESLFEYILQKLFGKTKIIYQGKEIDFSRPWRRIRYFDILEEKTGKGKDFYLYREEEVRKFGEEVGIEKAQTLPYRKLLDKIFEHFVEEELWNPTFVLDFPKVISPLAKTHRNVPDLVERFEGFIARMEVVNAYTELNDPDDQKERFIEQLRERQKGDEESMEYDEDFVRALEYGMPPTAGEGIGIDRLVMIFTNSPSIREVILFPTLKLQTKIL